MYGLLGCIRDYVIDCEDSVRNQSAQWGYMQLCVSLVEFLSQTRMAAHTVDVWCSCPAKTYPASHSDATRMAGPSRTESDLCSIETTKLVP